MVGVRAWGLAMSISDSDPTHAYLARYRCGCFMGAVVDWPGQEARTAREVGKLLRHSGVVERVTVEAVRAIDWRGCGKPDCGLAPCKQRGKRSGS